MSIEFQCPNGHKLSCPEDRAGRVAKCPRCGLTVQIPQPNGQPASDSAVTRGNSDSDKRSGDSDKSVRDSGGLKPGSGVGQGTFAFLCPNNHRLNGPLKLQGRAGQCPYCGVRFRIPMIDEKAEPSEGGAGSTTEPDLDLELPSDLPNPLGELFEPEAVAPPAAPHVELSIEDEPAPAAESYDEDLSLENLPAEMYDSMPDTAHPLARLFDKLWEEKQHGGVVELHVRDTGTLVPDWFERRLSQDSHGLFAVQAADGTLTLTAVAWDSVSRVVVRGVVALPEGMFE